VTRPVPPRGRRTAWWCRAGRSRSRPPPGVRVGREGSGRSAPARGSAASRPRRPRPPSPVNAGTDQPHRGSWLPARGWRLGQGQLQHPIPQRLRHQRRTLLGRGLGSACSWSATPRMTPRKCHRSGSRGVRPGNARPPRLGCRRPAGGPSRGCGAARVAAGTPVPAGGRTAARSAWTQATCARHCGSFIRSHRTGCSSRQSRSRWVSVTSGSASAATASRTAPSLASVVERSPMHAGRGAAGLHPHPFKARPGLHQEHRSVAAPRWQRGH
jgi:hypothetical protein